MSKPKDDLKLRKFRFNITVNGEMLTNIKNKYEIQEEALSLIRDKIKEYGIEVEEYEEINNCCCGECYY